ncbi:MAG: LytTR family DNA-binding domain-containing protein [Tannerellaceae bacterium]|jgi:DNA-binding LytR/AlgR family response regulator|nr:LytTR family DNA-binding domain-containing protein [Tannerellaceae bacterium]
MNVLIIENDTPSFDNLKHILLNISSDIHVAGKTTSVVETITWLESNPLPDLIFMDVLLPDGLAFNIFHYIETEIPVVITTVHEKYALKAFRLNSIDYLLKPLGKDDVRRALSKFNKQLNWQKLLSHFSQLQEIFLTRYSDILLIPLNDKLIPVHIPDIVCFYTNNEKTQLFLKDGQNILFNKSLDMILQSLNPQMFFRANKQFVIARRAVTHITIWFDSRLLLTLSTDTPERVYVSKNRAAEFKKWMSLGSGYATGRSL